MLFRNLKPGEKFDDPEFGPTKEDTHGRNSLYANGKVTPGGKMKKKFIGPDPDDVIWLHPCEITKCPRFMDKSGMNARDIKQGELGDCWFMTALSLLGGRRPVEIMGNMDPELLEKLDDGGQITNGMYEQLEHGIFPCLFHIYVTKGIYIFRFFKDYQKRYVIIDDKIPCRQSKVPIYGQDPDDKEFWVSLIEKAYAKLHGSYSSLRSGFIDEALTDLTSKVPEKIKLEYLKSESNPCESDIEGEWKRFNTLNTIAMLGCSAQGETEGPMKYQGVSCGILSGHAYALLDFLQIEKSGGKKRSRLIRMRNPWADTEWLLKWADNSDEIKHNNNKIIEEYKKIIQEKEISKYHMIFTNLEKYNSKNENDGTFFISYKDWREIFSCLFVCEDLFKDDKYRAIRYDGCWSPETSGGTPMNGTEEECIRWGKNPYVQVKMLEEENLFIVVSQEDPRVKANSEYPFVGDIFPFFFCILECAPMKKTVPK